MRAAFAIAGYWGTVFSSRLPAITPEEMLSFLGGAALTIAGPDPIPPRIPPMTPPGVPPPMPSMPETPAIEGGAADSLTCHQTPLENLQTSPNLGYSNLYQLRHQRQFF